MSQQASPEGAQTSTLRIALVSSRLPSSPGAGGAEAYVAQLAQALVRRHDVLLISGAAEELPFVRGVRIPALPYLQPVASTPTKIAWHLRDQWMPSVHRAVEKELLRFAPSVVHSHDPQGLSAAVFTAIAGLGLPHVHTAHDLGLLCARKTMTVDGEFCGGKCLPCLLQRTVRGRLFRRHIHRLIAPSDYLREVCVLAGLVEAQAAITIRQAAPPGPIRIRILPRPDDRAQLGFIGPLEPHKGLPTLLRAFRQAPPTWQLAIAGRGRLEPEVRASASADGRIHYAGYVTGAAKDDFLDALDLLVVPSEYEENAPLVVAEAAARGLPSVVSDRGGLPETPLARVFRARDERSLLDQMRWFLEHPERLVEASRRLVACRESFSWPSHVARVEEVLQSATARSLDRRKSR